MRRISDTLSAGGASVHSLKPRGKTLYVEFMTAFQLIALLSLQVQFQADGALFDDLHLIESADFLRNSRGEVRLSHHVVYILLEASCRENVVELVQLQSCAIEGTVALIALITHIHVHSENRLGSWVRDKVGAHLEKGQVTHQGTERVEGMTALLPIGCIVVAWLTIGAYIGWLLNAVYFELRWITTGGCDFDGIGLAVTTGTCELRMLEMPLAAVAEIPLVFCLHLSTKTFIIPEQSYHFFMSVEK